VIPGRARVVLLRNGSGRLEACESPEVCVVREVLEELRLKV
jgi:NADH pyrophosphatase NudC (nudix superfamily)